MKNKKNDTPTNLQTFVSPGRAYSIDLNTGVEKDFNTYISNVNKNDKNEKNNKKGRYVTYNNNEKIKFTDVSKGLNTAGDVITGFSTGLGFFQPELIPALVPVAATGVALKQSSKLLTESRKIVKKLKNDGIQKLNPNDFKEIKKNIPFKFV